MQTDICSYRWNFVLKVLKGRCCPINLFSLDSQVADYTILEVSLLAYIGLQLAKKKTHKCKVAQHNLLKNKKNWKQMEEHVTLKHCALHNYRVKATHIRQPDSAEFGFPSLATFQKMSTLLERNNGLQEGNKLPKI